MDEWIKNVVQPCNGILCSLKNSNTCYSMLKSWRHHTQWNKPVTKGQILYDSTLWGPSSSVQSVMSDSVQTHEPQHARPICPSPTPGVYPNSCPLCQWSYEVLRVVKFMQTERVEWWSTGPVGGRDGNCFLMAGEF